ncbi:hypothetical protein N7462_011315 [Penicillium macrosclerotiorum]|uniref:uncharacterized protein n=1 Tax=Penicillium macrosclerotiorum TaxID=303699 RepID=UPI00254739C6|nr:uncharacterized protein N7462_011315 [Penicillium macrosclerotiorum]KAJ5666906.1 hypothetical protein N7462_011315 [Penicillium macrosclerotiorum]
MALQLPVSALSSALRSQLAARRLAGITGFYARDVQNRLLNSRPYSNANTIPDEAPIQNEESLLESQATPPSIHDENANDHVQFGHKQRPKSPQEKQEGVLLMEIASSSGDTGSSIPRGVLELELKWLQDPRALGDRVARILQSGDPAKAAALVRYAHNQGFQTGVGWNHILSYCMQRGHPKAAFKFFNDMKKRNRKPNAATFTIMLKGFADAPKSRTSVNLAHSVYKSLFAPNSPVEPTIIHTNAMLHVCQRHNNLNMMWRIAGDLPEDGPGAPDMRTYTIILSALQYAARNDISALDPSKMDKITARQVQMVKEAKRIWADVVYRWTKDAVPIDNHVVNAMANLLLDGTRDQDFYDIFALYNQTMGIPILAKKPSSGQQPRELYRSRIMSHHRQAQEAGGVAGPSVEDDVPFVGLDSTPLKEEAPEPTAEEDEEVNSDVLFAQIVPGSEDLSYLKPGNKELTMIEDACFNITQGSSAGYAYWDILTSETGDYRIQPDAAAAVVYLRLLRLARASKRTVDVLRDVIIPSGQASGKLFHVGLASCRRDRRNASVLLHATEILNLMQKAMVLPDPRVLDGYLELIQALSDSPHTLLHLRGLSGEKDKTPSQLSTQGKKLQAELRLKALMALRPHIAQLHEAMDQGKPAPKTRWNVATHGGANVIFGLGAVKLMTRVRSLVDETLNAPYETFISKENRKLLKSDLPMLKKYCDRDVFEKFSKMTIHPTVAQRNAFRERALEFEEEAHESSEKNEAKREPRADTPLRGEPEK